MTLTGSEESKPAKVGSGVYDPAQMDRVHARSRTTGICWNTVKNTSVSLDTAPQEVMLLANLGRGSYPDETVSAELLKGWSVCKERL